MKIETAQKISQCRNVLTLEKARLLDLKNAAQCLGFSDLKHQLNGIATHLARVESILGGLQDEDAR